jgi:MFS family permease
MEWALALVLRPYKENRGIRSHPLRVESRARRFAKGLPMNDTPSHSISKTSWGEVALGLFPFVILGAAAALLEAPYKFTPGQTTITGYLGAVLFFGGYVLILAILFWACLKGFPRWSMPYLVYGTIFALYTANASTPGLVIFGIPMWGRQLWGWRAYVLVGFVILLGLLFSRPPWKPIFQLFKNIWNDWTFLPFGLYGLLPMIGPIMQDEMTHEYTLWTTIAEVLIVLAGAALYLIYARKPYRVAFLLGGLFFAALVAAIGTNYYWNTYEVNFTTGVRRLLAGPVPWQKIITDAFMTAGAMTLILALTGLVGLLHYAVNRSRCAAS